MAILFCFTSCSNNSASPVNSVPKIIDAYILNDDIICLYDDNTFTIIQKDKVGTISGTYTRDANGITLTVSNASDGTATSGDTLDLEFEDDGNINVSHSDIAGYEEGDKGEQTTPPQESGDSTSDVSHSIGDDLSEESKISQTENGKENFSAEQNAEGILIKFTIPKDTNAYEVYIDGIGLVTENYFGVGNMTEDDFFYPFLTPNKEYKIRVVFLKAEVEVGGWNFGHLGGSGVIGWFDVTAKAGAGSKGEVRLNDYGKITVAKNGDFKFTKKPTFENESKISNWVLGIGLNEGVSWLHEDRRSKWLTEIDIPNNELLNTKYNFYTYPRSWGDVTKVDFIVYRPKLFYKYGEKEYKYQWASYTLDTDCTAELKLWTDIDITKSADVAKIQGRWTTKNNWDDDDFYDIQVHVIATETLVIEGDTVKTLYYREYTKPDGTAFALSKEILDELKDYGYELSSDGKTITEEWDSDTESLSEYYADYRSRFLYSDGNVRDFVAHRNLKLFNDGSALQIITTYKFDDGGPDEYSLSNYQKQ